ncbi:sulfatase-like hydrolase/transferase [Novosphingobium resinovorum]|uniref:sulfatase-like hydrolase/transferase n=1 Tax=Novosphingobium resinovorum TaxID=158500 RepID=UPI003D2B7DEF
MATYAAMIEDLDANVGKLIAYLKKTGQYDNTLILFTSDNGPEALDLSHDYFLPNVTDWIEENYDNGYANIGSASSFVFLGEGWASAAATSHRPVQGLRDRGRHSRSSDRIVAGSAEAYRGSPPTSRP